MELYTNKTNLLHKTHDWQMPRGLEALLDFFQVLSILAVSYILVRVWVSIAGMVYGT